MVPAELRRSRMPKAETVTAQVAVFVVSPTAVAVMGAQPAPTAVTTPPLTVATNSSELDQSTLGLALVGATVAVKVLVPVTARDAVEELIVTPVTGSEDFSS